MKRVCLHGFLGRPSDWDFLPGEKVVVDLFSEDSLAKTSLQSFGDYLNATIPKGSLLIGYSLGGRLALHALIGNPSHWSGAVIISANPEAGEYARDQAWAKKFCTEEWNELMHLWNQQQTFSGAPPPRRLEEDFSRENLAKALLQWSRGGQTELFGAIAAMPIPLLWVIGGKEESYLEQSKRLAFSHPLSKIWIATESAHRVPWTQPKDLVEEIAKFEESL